MFLIWDHIGMQNCFFLPTVLVLAWNFAYMCAVCCGMAGKPVLTCASLLWEKDVYDGAWADVLLWSNASLKSCDRGLDSLLWRRLQYCMHWNANMVRTMLNSKCNLRKKKKKGLLFFDGCNTVLICFISDYTNIQVTGFGSITNDYISASTFHFEWLHIAFHTSRPCENPACWLF